VSIVNDTWTARVWVAFGETQEIWECTTTVSFSQFCSDVVAAGGLSTPDEYSPVFIPIGQILRITVL
jgi:hypothetical protein